MTIIDKLIPEGKYNRPGKASTPKRICVHYTGDAGASADRLALFFTANPNVETSSQYVVGIQGEIIRCLPDNEQAYAATGNNKNVIHIEVCHPDKSGKFTEKSIAALAELVPYLMKKYGIDANNVVRHYDLTGKHCPMYYVDSTRWAELKQRITSGTPAAGILYRVQIGAFSVRANAESYLKQADKKGFSGFIAQTSNGLYRVQIGAFASRQNALNYLAQAKQKGFDGFIVEVEK